jgi:hypothetical protein
VRRSAAACVEVGGDPNATRGLGELRVQTDTDVPEVVVRQAGRRLRHRHLGTQTRRDFIETPQMFGKRDGYRRQG